MPGIKSAVKSAANSATSARIHKLEARLVNQIAAGEVVVRPAAAVKELVENSLDAGASNIEVWIEPDTRSFTVRDDGAGMSAEDAELALERYATSKIETFEDLADLATRGFRGEALAAISAISRFELTTRRAEDDAATVIRCEGGAGIRLTETGAEPGTAVQVRDLFYNTPARMKFMKTATAEWGHIIKTFIRQALTRTDVAFSIRWRGKPYLSLPAGQSLRQRLVAVLPRAGEIELLDMDETIHGVRAWGCVSSPQSTRRDRRHQYYFVGGRPIGSRPLTFALQEAYRGLIMTQQFPMGAIFLELPAGEVDVNVHPTKEEVRFRNEPLAAGAVHRAALSALRKANLIPRLDIAGRPSSGPKPGAKPARPEPNGQATRSASTATPPPLAPGVSAPRGTGWKPAGPMPPLVDQKEFLRPPGAPEAHSKPGDDAGEAGRDPSDRAISSAAPTYAATTYADQGAAEEGALIRNVLGTGVAPRLLGQVMLTYILAEAPGLGMLLIDQHAVHEKILYMKYRKQKERLEIQELLVPYTFEAGPSGAAAMEALAPALTAAGFETTAFGGSTFLVQSVPLVFEGIDVGKLLGDLVEDMGTEPLGKELDAARHRVAASAACRAAVKAGDDLTRHEMQNMLDGVLKTDEALRCPHGRPTMLLLTREQLDRQFGRI